MQFLILPCALAVLELSYRGWLAVRGHPYRSVDAAAEIRELAHGMEKPLAAWGAADEEEVREAAVVLHPFLGFDIDFAQHGFARELKYFARAKSADVYDIVLLGGSVAAVFANEVGGELISHLRADPRFAQREVRLIAEARAGFKQPQQLNLMAYLFNLGFKPDAVINLDGFNELALSNYNAQNGWHPDLPSITHWGAIAGGRELKKSTLDLLLDARAAQHDATEIASRAETLGFAHSACLGRWTIARLKLVRARYAEIHDAYARAVSEALSVTETAAPPFDRQLERVVELSVDNWSESSRSLDAICRARGVHYLHVLQPTLHDRGSKPLSEREIETSAAHAEWIAAVHAGYAKLRDRGAELAAGGVHFADCSMVFHDVQQDLYFDACHFNRAGNEILARAIADRFLASLPSK